MRGGKRKGAGRPGKSLAAHLVEGTFRPGRHAAALAVPVAAGEWAPEPSALVALGAPGRALVTRLVAAYEMAPADGERLLQAARALDRAEAYRGLDRAALEPRAAMAADRLELQWRVLFDRLLSGLEMAK